MAYYLDDVGEYLALAGCEGCMSCHGGTLTRSCVRGEHLFVEILDFERSFVFDIGIAERVFGEKKRNRPVSLNQIVP